MEDELIKKYDIKKYKENDQKRFNRIIKLIKSTKKYKNQEKHGFDNK